jgi:hypothetical protein
LPESASKKASWSGNWAALPATLSAAHDSVVCWEMNDDEVIRQRAIARAQSCTLTEVNRVLDRFAETRKRTLALELARLDELQETGLWKATWRAEL